MEKRVMLVDDDPAIQRVVNIVLSGAGYDLCIANSGQECLDEVRSGFRGLILMDIMMPGLSGWDTIRAVVKEDLIEGISFCMFSALHETVSSNPTVDRYVVGRLRKPFTCAELLDAVKEYLA